MRFAIVLLQLILTVVITASVLPALLFAFPVLQEGRAGMSAAAAMMVTVFVVLLLVWPRRKASAPRADDN
jgi:hypothetical protein